MWMSIRYLILAGMVVFWATPGIGEFFKYTDDKGVLRYTDDLASVPPEQRPDVLTYQSVESSPVQTAKNQDAQEKTTRPKASVDNGARASNDSWTERNEKQKQELDRMQETLDNSFAALQAERSALEAKVPPEWAKSKQKLAYNKQVEALNARIASYEGQLDAYKEKLSAYKAQLKK